MTPDVIVIGAGLSGLVCARRLVAGGAKVIVVEARDRVGGRLLTSRVGDTTIDLGGQWMAIGQPRVAALATELGVESFTHQREGRVLMDGEPSSWFAKLAAALAQARAMRRIDRLMRAIPAGAPADAADARALDAESLADWLGRTIRNPIARERLGLHADLVFAANPADLSLLAYLATLGVTGGFAPQGPELPGGGREHRFTGGAQLLALRLAEQLEVRLGEPISAIEDADAVTARGPRGNHVAKRLVLAIPPGLVRSIDVKLPSEARRYVDAVKAGPVVKCFAAYARAFWREAGWSGEAYRPRGTVRATVSLGGDVPILLAFVVGSEAARWSARDPQQRRDEILATFVAQFGEQAATPLDYTEVDWGADPWSAGCVAGLRPGVITQGARWRTPHGRIHIAGTESAVQWPGYMEGAIEAGERAAAEVLAAL